MSTGKMGSNSEKGVTSLKMGKPVIQSCKCADLILAVTYFGETSLILKFCIKVLLLGRRIKTSHLTELSRQAPRSSRSEQLHNSKPSITKTGRGSSLTCER